MCSVQSELGCKFVGKLGVKEPVCVCVKKCVCMGGSVSGREKKKNAEKVCLHNLCVFA